MNVAPLFLLCGLCFIGMGDLSGTIPVAVQFGIVAVVGCFFSILVKIEARRKRGQSLAQLSYVSSINKFLMSIMATLFLTWVAQKYVGASVDMCYLLSAAVGGTIEQSAPWIQVKVFDWLKTKLKL